MIRFEVSGATAEEFARNAIQAWGVLATGLQQLLAAANTGPPAIGSGEAVTALPAAAAAASVEVNGHGLNNLAAASAATAPVSQEPAPASPAGASAASVLTPPKFKPEQIKDRLAEVVLAQGTAAGRDLLAKVGAKKITDVDTDEKRALFMELSVQYSAPRAPMDDEIPF